MSFTLGGSQVISTRAVPASKDFQRCKLWSLYWRFTGEAGLLRALCNSGGPLVACHSLVGKRRGLTDNTNYSWTECALYLDVEVCLSRHGGFRNFWPGRLCLCNITRLRDVNLARHTHPPPPLPPWPCPRRDRLADYVVITKYPCSSPIF